MESGSLLIYASSNGDKWLLARDEAGEAFVRHIPNPASNGKPSEIEIASFLSRDTGSPQRKRLLHMIGSLVQDVDGAAPSSSSVTRLGE
jgi:hypothetical protein